MTKEQFDKTTWIQGMRIKHNGFDGVFSIEEINFRERLLCLSNFFEDGTNEWVNYENIETVYLANEGMVRYKLRDRLKKNNKRIII